MFQNFAFIVFLLSSPLGTVSLNIVPFVLWSLLPRIFPRKSTSYGAIRRWFSSMSSSKISLPSRSVKKILHLKYQFQYHVRKQISCKWRNCHLSRFRLKKETRKKSLRAEEYTSFKLCGSELSSNLGHGLRTFSRDDIGSSTTLIYLKCVFTHVTFLARNALNMSMTHQILSRQQENPREKKIKLTQVRGSQVWSSQFKTGRTWLGKINANGNKDTHTTTKTV